MTATNTTQRYLAFRVSGRTCAVRLACLQEIVPMALLSCPPGMPPILQGFLNLAGTAVPVLRLARLLGFEAQPLDLYTPLLIVRGKPGLLALLVDSVAGVMTASAEALSAVDPQYSFNGCADAALAGKEDTIHLLATDRLLLEMERQCLIEMRALEQQRLQDLNPAEVPA